MTHQSHKLYLYYLSLNLIVFTHLLILTTITPSANVYHKFLADLTIVLNCYIMG